jgi:SpoVK/Ycf46/Vps4 family AAA+-type ATPase
MTLYTKRGDTFHPASEESMDLHHQLPVGNYIIKKDAFGNLYFQRVDNFEFKHKRYGDNEKNTDRIFSTFMDREVSTGVMLTGEKGSGKSLLAKCLSMKGAELNIPTLIINDPWCGDQFNRFIQEIQQPCIVLFDEFEKVYDRDSQESILTLLDGVFPTKKLFVLTCNDKWRVDQHMRNRPGRIYYMLDFKGLSVEFIEEYCNDNLKNKSHIDNICKISSLFAQFNFDILKSLVEEMNRYNESAQEALAILNAKPEFDEGNKFSVQLQINGVTVDPDDYYNGDKWSGNPLQGRLRFEYRTYKDDPEDGDWVYANFTQTDLKNVDALNGKFVFMNEKNEIMTLTKVKDSHFNFHDVF